MACATSNGIVGTVAVELTGPVKRLQHKAPHIARWEDLLV